MKKLLIALAVFVASQVWAQTPAVVGEDDFSNAVTSAAKWDDPGKALRVADNMALLMFGKPQTGERILFRNSQGWADYEVSCKLKFLPSEGTNGQGGLFVRRDGNNAINIHLTKNLKFLYVGGSGINPSTILHNYKA